MDRRRNPSSVDIQKVLLDMREYRMGLIQTPDQLRFSYMAVIEGAKLILTDNSMAQVAQSQGWGARLYLSPVQCLAHVWAVEMILTSSISSSAN